MVKIAQTILLMRMIRNYIHIWRECKQSLLKNLERMILANKLAKLTEFSPELNTI
ncbi:hypothetical protein NMYAN_140003 [Nitrosomonas nitrosa]|uniref:Uncharacterized protein n=1 Tax=Nitrosomonas nitrosa TaxID=52442 RepID=A0A8H9D9M2_9PROT|nr:hypothetical protein NMYAN_140003 [Nitrosomonas nitrosa]